MWRIFTYGKWKSSESHHRWPSLTAVDVCEDDPPFRISHRWYQFVWFGKTLNLELPTHNASNAWTLDSRSVAEWFCKVLG